MKVLIIEDDPVWSNRISGLIGDLGLEFDIATTWNSAFTKIKGPNSYYRIISDLSVGTDSESGIQSLAILAEKFAPPPTLVVTTYLDNRMQRHCAEISFVRNAITKPSFDEHLEDFEDFIGAGKLPRKDVERQIAMTNQAVFVVHGRDSAFRDSIFSFLRALGLKPIEWGDAINLAEGAAPYIGDIIDSGLENCQAVIILLSPDDEVRLRKSLQKNSDPKFEKVLTGQARPNVLFEAGLAFGKLPGQTIFVAKGELRPFSDVTGRHIIHFSNSQEFRIDLANRLEKVGCPVNRSGSDWINIEL